MADVFLTSANFIFMYKRIATILLAYLATSFYSGCRTCNCVDGEISFHFSGYSTAELQNIVVKKYALGSNFGQRTDSIHFSDAIDYRLEQRSDVIYLNPKDSRLNLRKDGDYQIELPAANRTYRITDIRMRQVRDQCGGKSICINPVESIRIDGTLLEGPIIGLLGFTLRK